MEAIDEAKTQRRRELKKARTELGDERRAAIDAKIAKNVQTLPEYENADLILPYLSFGAEIDTRALIEDAWSRGKTVALPRCVEGTRDMRWYRVESLDSLVMSKFGVEEPAENPAFEVDPNAFERALAFVPGLEFDREGYRLGYGGGFYDTFLSAFAGISVGLCREPFLRAEGDLLQRGAYDLAAQMVVTDVQIVRCR